MLLVKNRRAYYDYEIIEKFLAGMVLRGYEVKALREKKANFDGAYIKVDKGEVFVVNMYIGRYSKQSQEVSDTNLRNQRKLLLTKQETERLQKAINEKGRTAVPLALLLKNNMIKLEIAVVKGKKIVGKKHVAKEKQVRRDMEKEKKDFERGM
jgi:SsrA-binding protein